MVFSRIPVQVLLLELAVIYFCFGGFSTAQPVISKVLRTYNASNPPLNMPVALVVDKYDNVYVTDFENARVVKFDLNGTFLMSLTTSDPPLKSPRGLAVDAELNVYIADTPHNRVVKLDAGGKLVHEYTGDLDEPSGLAVDSEGFVYVSDGKSRVIKIAPNDTVVMTYKNLGGGLAIDLAGNLLVAQSTRALRFDTKTGALLMVWNTTDPPLTYVTNIAVDVKGIVYIADAFGGHVVSMDDNNNVVAIYEPSGKPFCAIGVAITSTGNVLIANCGNKVVLMDSKEERSALGKAVVA
jgi:serine/threonine-protein kinase